MSEELKLKILDSFDGMIQLFADDLDCEFELVEECGECEEGEVPSEPLSVVPDAK